MCTGGVAATPNQITTKHRLTATAGMESSAVIPIDSTRMPLASAPAITPSSSAATRNPAARRVSLVCAPVWAVRRWMIEISSGSHTT